MNDGRSVTKQLNYDNWLTQDAAWSNTHGMEFTDDSNREWIAIIQSVQLNASAPENIRVLFSAAQGALVYSIFFHPIMTLALDQVARLVESAARAKYKQISSTRWKNFEKSIAWFLQQGIIAAESEKRWTAMRHLRNNGSHPQTQYLYSLGMMAAQLEGAAELINELYPG